MTSRSRPSTIRRPCLTYVNLSTPQSVATGAIPFTVADIDTVLDSLLLSVSSDNALLLPPGNLVLAGSGASRTLTLTPAPDVHGTATVTVQVSDGTTVVSDTFVLTVTPVDPPTLSDIGPQVTVEATATGAIPFTVDDVDGGVATLTVSGGSDNATLVPPANIVFGGTGANRTVTVTPAAGESGIATITVTVSDGTASADDTFTVTVSAVDDPPTITDIGPQAIAEDGSTGAIAFLVDDPDTPVATLAVAATSDNATLVPPAGIALGGTNPTRTITVTPAANQHGSATITVTVERRHDATVSDTFVVTVSGVDDPPTITDIGAQATDEDTSTGAIAFTVGDPDSVLAGLLVTATSDNATLVPPASLTLGGADASRTIAILPASNESGSATITVTVTDGTTPVSDTFTLTVNAVNDVPSITAIADQTINEDTSSPALAFTVGDVETAAVSLVTSVSASNAVLFPQAAWSSEGRAPRAR